MLDGCSNCPYCILIQYNAKIVNIFHLGNLMIEFHHAVQSRLDLRSTIDLRLTINLRLTIDNKLSDLVKTSFDQILQGTKFNKADESLFDN